MPGANTAAIPITVFKVIGSADALPLQQRLPEDATCAVNLGTPVLMESGFAEEADAISGTTVTIAGITAEPGHNLATAGTAPIGGSAVTYGSVPGQSAAVNIPIGAPMADGTLGVYLACDTTIFQGVTDSSHTNAAADVGSIFGLTKDSGTKNWFVDTTITAAGSGACVEVTELIDGVGVGAFGVGTTGGRVAFKFTRAYQQMFT